MYEHRRNLRRDCQYSNDPAMIRFNNVASLFSCRYHADDACYDSGVIRLNAVSFEEDPGVMVKSAVRVLDILEFVSQAEDGCSHSEIVSGLAIPPSSLTALLRDLTQANYIAYDDATGRYTVGPQVLHLSNAYMRNLSLVRLGQPILLELFRELNEYSSLSVPRETEIIKVCEYAINDPRAYAIKIGESGPMHALAAGKAILAHYPQAVQKRVLEKLELKAYTDKTLRSRRALLMELKEIRAGAIAYTREEYLPGMIGLGVPVFNHQDNVVAAIAVTTPAVRFSARHEQKVERALRAASIKLSRRLGHRPSLAA
jgi:DNA-binding IclR family transcriptional regulator